MRTVSQSATAALDNILVEFTWIPAPHRDGEAPPAKDSTAHMAPGYHIASDDGLISIQVGSEIDLADLYELAKSVISSADYEPELPLIVDLRGMALDWHQDATEPFVRYIIDNFRNREGSMAVVLDGDMSRDLVAGIYWLACAVGGTEVFDDYDHALKWLIRREFADPPPENVVSFSGSAASAS